MPAVDVYKRQAQRIQAAAQKNRPRVIRFRRPLAVASVFCLILACSMGVLATTVPSVQNLFAIVGTQRSSMLQPIERSCTDNGIETTVVAAMNDNDMVDILSLIHIFPLSIIRRVSQDTPDNAFPSRNKRNRLGNTCSPNEKLRGCSFGRVIQTPERA